MLAAKLHGPQDVRRFRRLLRQHGARKRERFCYRLLRRFHDREADRREESRLSRFCVGLRGHQLSPRRLQVTKLTASTWLLTFCSLITIIIYPHVIYVGHRAVMMYSDALWCTRTISPAGFTICKCEYAGRVGYILSTWAAPWRLHELRHRRAIRYLHLLMSSAYGILNWICGRIEVRFIGFIYVMCLWTINIYLKRG